MNQKKNFRINRKIKTVENAVKPYQSRQCLWYVNAQKDFFDNLSRKSPLQKKEFFIPSDDELEVHPTITIEAQINWGRWLVQCPSCRAGQEISFSDPLFYCSSCCNVEFEHKALSIIFPKDELKSRIEKQLLKRPLERTRNWTSLETIEDLKKQNQEKGID